MTSATIKQIYDVYLNTEPTAIIRVGNAVCLETHGKLHKFGFRYTTEYLHHPFAFSLDPHQLPLSRQEFQFDCSSGIPGILDDYLPDAWGRRVMAHLTFYRDKKKLNKNSCIAMLSELGNSRIGALQWTLPGHKPLYDLGASLEKLKAAEHAAQIVDSSEMEKADLNELALPYLANAGTGIGGARPKALIEKNSKAFLAKFNRLTQDEYNNARVELACLKMAEYAKIDVFSGEIIKGINTREALLLERFDIDKKKTECRKHLISVNSLLKSSQTQADKGGVFRYNDIADLIRKHSISVEKDLLQLLKVMLFNKGINNTDDHERNFSFINNGEGYQLSPAYDMVPSLTRGAYHVAGFNYQPSPPLPSKITKQGKVFGLPKTRVAQAQEAVINALGKWEEFADLIGVSDEDASKIKSIISI